MPIECCDRLLLFVILSIVVYSNLQILVEQRILLKSGRWINAILEYVDPHRIESVLISFITRRYCRGK